MNRTFTGRMMTCHGRKEGHRVGGYHGRKGGGTQVCRAVGEGDVVACRLPRPPRLRSRGWLLLTLRVAPPRSTFSFSACSPATKQRNRNPGGSAERFHLNIERATNFFGTRIPIPHARQGGTARDSHRQTFALMRSKLYFGILQKRAACSRTSEHPWPGISPYWEAIEPFLHVVKPGGINLINLPLSFPGKFDLHKYSWNSWKSINLVYTWPYRTNHSCRPLRSITSARSLDICI